DFRDSPGAGVRAPGASRGKLAPVPLNDPRLPRAASPLPEPLAVLFVRGESTGPGGPLGRPPDLPWWRWPEAAPTGRRAGGRMFGGRDLRAGTRERSIH